MRGATQCARRLKLLLRSLRRKLGKVSRPAAGDATTQMILGIFSRDMPESKAREVLDRLRAMVVDYNELRVVAPIEMAGMVGEVPDARLKCEDLSRALNRVFSHEHEVSLDRLGGLPRKEVVEYLESIDGLDAYSRARVRLLGLQQHAVPLDEAMWAYARKTRIVGRRCPLEQAQAFLERRLPEGEALEFVALLGKQAWAEMEAAVREGEVERIRSVPPDRTARNMLQLVASGRAGAISPPRPQAAGTGGAGASTPAATVTGDKQAAKSTGRPRAEKSAKRAGRKPGRPSQPRNSERGRPPSAKPRRNRRQRGRPNVSANPPSVEKAG